MLLKNDGKKSENTNTENSKRRCVTKTNNPITNFDYIKKAAQKRTAFFDYPLNSYLFAIVIPTGCSLSTQFASANHCLK